METIVLGGGCFWCVEGAILGLKGVSKVIPGYSGGHIDNPTYEQVCSKNSGHAEVIEVTFNSEIIPRKILLEVFFTCHDPTQLNRQGNDIGTQYRSVILYTENSQIKIIEDLISKYQVLLNQSGYKEIKTSIKPLKEFFVAENYHQDYIKKNPNGYCPDHSTGVRFASDTTNQKQDNDLIKIGKNIIVIEPEGYCPYCENFKKDVSNDYQGTIPLVSRLATNLEGLEIKTPTWATPTILFLENGKEVFGYQGYLSPKEFYKALGFFKLGNSEAYRVAFDEGTDARFCKEYEIFKNTPDGVFIDKLSGAALFDTRDRFNSKTGWLSFTKPVKNSVYRKADNSYGMRRIEIRSTTSDIHLGHVFPDGPNGMPRYCINATVLEFKTRGEFNKSKTKEKV